MNKFNPIEQKPEQSININTNEQINIQSKKTSSGRIIIAVVVALAIGFFLGFIFPSSFKPGTNCEPNSVASTQYVYFCDPKMQIIYVWIGGKVPSKYQKVLDTAKYPHKLIGIKEYEKYKSKYHISVDLAPVAKADLLRVAYLIQHGGFYSDFDNQIDYCCIMHKIKDTKGLILGRGYSNSFLIAQQPNSMFLQNVIANASQRQNNSISMFMGPWIFDVYWNDSQFTVIDFGKCVNHTGDFTWKDQAKNNW